MAARLRTACAVNLLPLLLLLALPVAVQAQFLYHATNNNSAIFITGYTGPGGAVTIPDTINGLPVTGVGWPGFNGCTSVTSLTIPNSVMYFEDWVFFSCTGLTNVTIGNRVHDISDYMFAGCTSLTSFTIPDSVVNIWNAAFFSCTALTNVTIGNGVTRISPQDFAGCTSLTSVTIGKSVTSMGWDAFGGCKSLTSVTFPPSVTSLDDGAFYYCTSLRGAYFQGDAPTFAGGLDVFDFDNNATVYYLPGTKGWGPTFGGRPTQPWNPQVQTGDASFGVRTNRFGFTITGTSNLVVVVEASTSLQYPQWVPLGTNTLTGGSSNFSDPRWTNIPARFYRLRSP
jgi:hypothetical protein